MIQLNTLNSITGFWNQSLPLSSGPESRFSERIINWFYGWSSVLFEDKKLQYQIISASDGKLAFLYTGNSVEWELYQEPKHLIFINLVSCLTIFIPSVINKCFRSLRNYALICMITDDDNQENISISQSVCQTERQYSRRELKSYNILTNEKCTNKGNYKAIFKAFIRVYHKLFNEAGLMPGFKNPRYCNLLMPLLHYPVEWLYICIRGHDPPIFNLKFVFSRRI
jgi:hypothetical protein